MLEIFSDLFKTCPKIHYFYQQSKKAKKWPNGQMAKPLYFWKTVSKKAKWQQWLDSLANRTKELLNICEPKSI